MLNPTGVTLADYIAAVKADKPSHVRLTFTGQSVVLTDDDIESSGITLNHFLNGDTDLTMGKAVMANITVPIIHTAKINDLIWSGEFQFEIGQVIDNNTTEWITVGYFAGTRPEKVDSVDVIEFTANDRMNRFERLADDWVASLTYPITVEGLFQSLCNYCGVGYVSGDELPNMFARSYSVSPFLMEGQTCRDILGQIAEACGCYAKITADGNCKLVWFEDHTGDYSLDAEDEFPPVEVFDHTDGKQWQELESLTWQDLEGFKWSDFVSTESLFEINSLNIVDSIGGYNIKYPGGLNGNIYTIVDNPFLMIESDADKVAYLKPIFDRFTAFGGYIPLRVDAIGCALIEAGDIIEVDVNGETLNLPIFTKMSKWNGAVSDEYQSTGQLNRADVSIETKAKLSEAGRYRLAMAQIELVAQGKYDIQSNINILPEGIEVSGGKYVKIESGGTFDVDSENFKISSTDKKMTAGNWIYGETGITYDNNATGTFYIYPNTNDLSGFPFEEGFGLSVLSPFTDDFRIFTGYNRGVDPSVDNVLSAFIFTKYRGETISTLELGTKNKETGLYTNGGRIKNLHEIWNGALQDLKVISLSISLYPQYNSSDPNVLISSSGDVFLYHEGTSTISLWGQTGDIYCNHVYQSSSRDVKNDIKSLPSSGELIDRLNPVSFSYRKDKDSKQQYGLVYEEVEEVLPELCSEQDGQKGVNYTALVPLLLKEIQDLRKRVADLDNRVAELEKNKKNERGETK